MKTLKSRLLDRIKSVGSKQFPVNSKELEKYFGISGQSIRGLIRQLRREGNIIVGCNLGYYSDTSPEAVRDIVADLEKRAFSMLETAKEMKSNYACQEGLF